MASPLLKKLGLSPEDLLDKDVYKLVCDYIDAGVWEEHDSSLQPHQQQNDQLGMQIQDGPPLPPPPPPPSTCNIPPQPPCSPHMSSSNGFFERMATTGGVDDRSALVQQIQSGVQLKKVKPDSLAKKTSGTIADCLTQIKSEVDLKPVIPVPEKTKLSKLTSKLIKGRFTYLTYYT